jgi:hypothetical protein
LSTIGAVWVRLALFEYDWRRVGTIGAVWVRLALFEYDRRRVSTIGAVWVRLAPCEYWRRLSIEPLFWSVIDDHLELITEWYIDRKKTARRARWCRFHRASWGALWRIWDKRSSLLLWQPISVRDILHFVFPNTRG